MSSSSSSSQEDLLNYTLHDDKGKGDKKAKYFNESMIINAGEYLVLCRNVDFDFGIGGDDVVTLLDNNGAIVSQVMLLGSSGNSEENQTFAFFNEDNKGGETYQYTAMPTPGQANVYVEPIPLEVKLAEQNEEGGDFFLEKESNGTVVFDKVVDLHVTLSNESLATIGKQNYGKALFNFSREVIPLILSATLNSSFALTIFFWIHSLDPFIQSTIQHGRNLCHL